MVAEKAGQGEAPKAETAPDVIKKEPATEGSPKNDSFKKPLAPAKKQGNLEEQKPEVTTSTKDEGDQSKPPEDGDQTLILSAEEEAEISAQTNEDAVKEQPSKKVTGPKSAKQKNQKNIWVSNISRSTKAADLKKLFSQNYKVESAKIVTNGKSYFGYICLETAEMAQKSASELNGSTLSGKKITVALSRPDLRAAAGKSGGADAKRGREPKKEPRVSNGTKKSEKIKEPEGEEAGKKVEEAGTEAPKDAKETPTTVEKKKEDSLEAKLKQQQRREQKANQRIQELKMDLNRVTTELQNNRRRLTEANRRLDAERTRKTSLRRELETMEGQLKSERRRFAQDLEQMEKKRKSDEIRYQDDRAALNKELDECRKLREYLQRKIDDVGIARHGRSPPRRSGPGGRGLPERGADKMARTRIHSTDGRGGRSPPPPPKINSRRSRERSPPSYKGGKKPRLDGPPNRHSSFGSNHYPGQAPSFSTGGKSLLGQYPQSGSTGGQTRNPMYGTTAYPVTHTRYGSSSGYPSSGYPLGNPTSLMSRPIGYPDVRGSSSGQRKY